MIFIWGAMLLMLGIWSSEIENIYLYIVKRCSFMYVSSVRFIGVFFANMNRKVRFFFFFLEKMNQISGPHIGLVRNDSIY